MPPKDLFILAASRSNYSRLHLSSVAWVTGTQLDFIEQFLTHPKLYLLCFDENNTRCDSHFSTLYTSFIIHSIQHSPLTIHFTTCAAMNHLTIISCNHISPTKCELSHLPLCHIHQPSIRAEKVNPFLEHTSKHCLLEQF